MVADDCGRETLTAGAQKILNVRDHELGHGD